MGAMGCAGRPRSPAFRPSQWKNAGIYGSMRTGSASTPTKRWFIVVLEATHMRRMRRAESLASLHISAIRGTSVSLMIASCNFLRPPGLPCSMIRLMTSAP